MVLHSSTVDTMLARDGLPEGSTDLVTLGCGVSFNSKPIRRFLVAYALAGLEVNLSR